MTAGDLPVRLPIVGPNLGLDLPNHKQYYHHVVLLRL